MNNEDKPLTKEQELQAMVDVAETVTEKPVTFDIDIKPKNKIHVWLIERNIMPSKRHFEIKKQRTVNVYRIAGRAVLIDLKGVNPDPKQVETIGYGVHIMMDLLARHGEDIFYIVACALQNDHREPTKKMLDIVKYETTIEELFYILTIAISNYKIQSFLNSIVLIKGVDVLNPQSEKASPQVIGG